VGKHRQGLGKPLTELGVHPIPKRTDLATGTINGNTPLRVELIETEPRQAASDSNRLATHADRVRTRAARRSGCRSNGEQSCHAGRHPSTTENLAAQERTPRNNAGAHSLLDESVQATWQCCGSSPFVGAGARDTPYKHNPATYAALVPCLRLSRRVAVRAPQALPTTPDHLGHTQTWFGVRFRSRSSCRTTGARRSHRAAVGALPPVAVPAPLLS
jgi:hypothetical protein